MGIEFRIMNYLENKRAFEVNYTMNHDQILAGLMAATAERGDDSPKWQGEFMEGLSLRAAKLLVEAHDAHDAEDYKEAFLLNTQALGCIYIIMQLTERWRDEPTTPPKSSEPPPA